MSGQEYHLQCPDQFERFAEKIFGVSTPEEGITALDNWFNKIGTPTHLSQLGISKNELPAIIANASIL